MLTRLLDTLTRLWMEHRTRQAIKDFDMPDPQLKRALLEGGNLEIAFKHEAVTLLAQSVADLFAEFGGPNFVEFTMAAPSGLFVVTVAPRKPGIKTPGEVVGELQARIAELEAQSPPEER